MDIQTLETVARQLVQQGKGILAADESFGTIKKRFDALGIESTEENRRAYRELLFTTPGIEDFISGVILFDETIHQATRDGTPFPQLLASRGILPGIKVDEGTLALANFPGEKITQGLDGLRTRLDEYLRLGARFAKWRAVITLGPTIPSQTCIQSNAELLARYAAICQGAGLAPIVEPEVLMEGDHTIERCETVTRTTLQAVFDALLQHRVLLEGMLLKPNMVVPGLDAPAQASVQEVAQATVRCLLRSVPAAVPGIVFLSGGQTPEQAALHLSAMNAMGDFPWQLSFSFGRALQDPAMKAWKANAQNAPEAQRLFSMWARNDGAARFGQYNQAVAAGA